MCTNLLFDLLKHFGMFLQILLGVLSSLSNLVSFIGIPCTTLIYDAGISRQIEDIPNGGDSFSKDNIKFSFLKRRCNLILL